MPIPAQKFLSMSANNELRRARITALILASAVVISLMSLIYAN